LVLVDTSALISFLTGAETEAARYLERLAREDAPFALTSVVVQEVLQGARDERQWRRLHVYLTSQLQLEPRDPLETAVQSARILFDCRRRGLTVRSGTDCWVAQIALEHDVPLLHDDRDYDAVGRVRPLKTLP